MTVQHPTLQSSITQHQRSASLKAIVAYKGLVVLVLIIISLISALSWRHYDALVILAEKNLADGEFALSDWFLKTVLHNQVPELRWVARVAGVYALIMGIATVGLWYAQRWANPLMILMVGLPLPVEIQELLHEKSWQRLIIFLLNLTVFGYLVKHQISEETS